MATYCILGLRFHILYKDSQCRVNPTILFMVSFLGSFWTLILAIRWWSAHAFSTDDEKDGFIVVYQSLSKNNNSNDHSVFSYCYSESPDWYLLVHASIDTIMNSTYCLLFAFPIQIIMTHVKIASKLQRDHDLDSTNDKTLSKNVTTHNYSDQEKYNNQKNEKHSTRPEGPQAEPKNETQRQIKTTCIGQKESKFIGNWDEDGNFIRFIVFFNIIHINSTRFRWIIKNRYITN